jgi:sulfate adenylyltransferase
VPRARVTCSSMRKAGMEQGVVVWLTGLPSAGKTTIATLVCKRLTERGQIVEHLDGDVMRQHLGKGLGFSKEDRDENVRRIGFVAGLLARHGVTVLVSAVSPYRVIRDEIRASVSRFIEVHVATSLATCQARDVKGLYVKHARGELNGLTGLDDPYEPPLVPELVLKTEYETPASSAERVLALLLRISEGGYDPSALTASSDWIGLNDRCYRSVPAASSQGSLLPAPHGGQLVNRLLEREEGAVLAQVARQLPTVRLDGRGLADLECLAVGAFSPLGGFLRRADYATVVASGHLANGLVWTLPVVLSAPPELLASAPDRLALAASDGRPLAVLELDEVYDVDPVAEAMAVYGTDDAAHPGVAAIQGRRGPLVGGSVHVIALPVTAGNLGPRLTPAQTRAAAAARGWRSMAGFQTRNPVHRAHEYLHKVALEQVDGLLLHPLVGWTKDDDVPAELRMASYRALLDAYYPSDRVMLSVFPAAMRYAGPREAIFHALVRKNYGCTHFIVGRDHAGIGNYYTSSAAQEAFDRYDPTELGIVPLKFEHAFFCRRCDSMATSRTCPHAPSEHATLSGTAVRSFIREGRPLPAEFCRPEVARLLTER